MEAQCFICPKCFDDHSRQSIGIYDNEKDNVHGYD